MNSGVSANPAACCGVADEYDYVLTLRFEIPCRYLDEPSFVAESFNPAHEDVFAMQEFCAARSERK